MATEYLDVRIVPHGLTDPECCGWIVAIVREDLTELRCNECDAVVGTIQTAIFRGLVGLDEFADDCPNCGYHNVFVAFDELLHYTCKKCGTAIPVPESSGHRPGWAL